MCYAILRVRYRAEKGKGEYIEIERSADLPGKLDELKGRTETIQITVFRCEQRIVLEQKWTATPYTEEVKGEAP